ncbi:glycosyltransferase family 2 protein [Cedecea davisae]|uniref:glycosyltransferase family 2 protein n=1 Tax=Cedecea davisae TaxID=158484 RepID=UPI00376EEFCF
MKKELELVSIIIVTYNSAEYVIETLNSCIEQTYANIEIIISDDGSVDETLSLCNAWLVNLSVDVNVKIITHTERRGIPANCNRGANVASGQWLKFIGADDILEPDAISNLMRCTTKDTGVVFSRFKTFGKSIFKEDIYPYPLTWDLVKKRASGWNERMEWLFLLGFSNVAPGAFINKEAFYELGKYDESYYLLEDLPLWYKLFESKYSVRHCESITVNYRIHPKQATSNGISDLLKKDLLKFTNEKRNKYIIPYYHNIAQIKFLSNKKAARFRYLNIVQVMIHIYNRLGR